MATILTKKSDTASSVPLVADLTNAAGGAELAVNTADKRLFTKTSGGTVVELGTNPSTLALPNGTAKGVPYLNGSKVLTTGSALTFDGTNLGLGVTPSAWFANSRAIDIGTGGAVQGRSNDATTFELATNAYLDSAGTWRYKTTNRAGLFALSNGSYAWNVAASGTAGNAITFTQAMTLFASNGLAVGHTSDPGAGSISTTAAFAFTNGTNARAGSSGQYIITADSGGLYQQAGGSYYLVMTAGGATSDATLKKNVTQLSGALGKICAIRGVSYEFIAGQKSTPDNGVQVGVIAQEVEAQYPEIIVTNEKGIKSVRYEKLVAPLIEAIKEQQAIIEGMKTRLAALESK